MMFNMFSSRLVFMFRSFCRVIYVVVGGMVLVCVSVDGSLG